MELIYKIDDKRRLYELLNLYLEGKISDDEFADEFYVCYDKELDYNTLSPKEYKLFSNLSFVVGRMTDEETYKDYPYILTTPEEVKKKAKEVKEALQDEYHVLRID